MKILVMKYEYLLLVGEDCNQDQVSDNIEVFITDEHNVKYKVGK